MHREVDFYKTKKGESPVEIFLDSLPDKTAKKITWVFDLVEELRMVPSLYFKKLTGSAGIWECRIKLGTNHYRVFAFFDGNDVILTHGIVKKTQKTPDGEIRRAEGYKEDYFSRKRREKWVI